MQTDYKSREDLKTNLLYNDNYDGKNPRYDVESKWIGKDKDGNNLYIGVATDPGLQSDNHKFTESLRLMLNEIEQKSTLKKDEDKKYLDKNWDNGYENRILTQDRFKNGYTYFELFTRDEETLDKKQLAVMSGNISKDDNGYQATILNTYVPEEERGKKYSELLILHASKILLKYGVERLAGSMSQDSQNVHSGLWTDNIVKNAGYEFNTEATKDYDNNKTYQINTYGTKGLYPVAKISQENTDKLEKNLESKGFNFTIGKSSNKKTYEADTSHIKAFNAKQNEQYGLGR